jgi:hypothetical protein
MVAQARARPTVAPSLSSGYGVAPSSRREVFDDVEEAEDYEELAESLDDRVQRDCWVRACGCSNCDSHGGALVGYSVSCDNRSGQAIGTPTTHVASSTYH